MARSSLVGRDEALDAIAALASDAFTKNEAGTRICVGAQGVGRSALLDSAIDEITLAYPRTCVWQIKGDPNRFTQSWYGIGDVLAATVFHDRGGSTDDRIQALVECGMEVVSAKVLVRALSSQEASEALATAGQIRDAVVVAIGELMAVITAGRPLTIVVDDIQWVDQATLNALAIGIRFRATAPIVMLVGARPHALENLGDLFAEMNSSFADLAPLNQADSLALVRGLAESLQVALADEVLDVIAGHSGGNPLFATELVRHVCRKINRYGAEGVDANAFALPLSLEDLIHSQLYSLAPRVQLIAGQAAVHGYTFSPGALTGDTREMVRDSVEALARYDLVVEAGDFAPDGDGSGNLRFRNAAIRDVAYGMATESKRRSWHRIAGEWLTRNGGRSLRIAHHFSRAGLPGRAAQYWERGAEAAAAQGDLTIAADAIERSFASTLEPHLSLRRGIVMVNYSMLLGDFGRARLALAALRDINSEMLFQSASGAVAVFARFRIQRLLGTGDVNFPQAVGALGQIISGFEAIGDTTGAQRALVDMLRICAENSHAAPDGLVDFVVSPGLSELDEGLWRRYALFMNDWVTGADLDRTLESGFAARDVARSTSSWRALAALLGDLAQFCVCAGRYEQAVDVLREALDVARRLGYRHTEITIQCHLVRALLLSGDSVATADAAHAARSLAISRGDSPMSAYIHSLQSRIGGMGAGAVNHGDASVEIPVPPHNVAEGMAL